MEFTYNLLKRMCFFYCNNLLEHLSAMMLVANFSLLCLIDIPERLQTLRGRKLLKAETH